MKEKVIFDTNFLFNKVASSFFGSRNELNTFLNDAELIIPDIVIEELQAKYIRIFGDDKLKFEKTLLSNIVEHNTNEIIIENKISELINSETIAFTQISLTDYSVLPEIKRLAIQKLPPFEQGEGTDKGFKDAYIYFTIMEYLQNVPDRFVFVCSKDKRFKKTFDDNTNIIVIESYEEFKEHSISQFFNEYFIEKINSELSITISKDNIKEYWYNINDNKVVLIGLEDQEYIIETDSGEIISTCNRSDFQINNLINSSSFRMTHRSISELENYTNFLSNDEVKIILEASYSNQEIRLIINDSDVKEFLASLYNTNIIEDNDAKNFLKEIFE